MAIVYNDNDNLYPHGTFQHYAYDYVVWAIAGVCLLLGLALGSAGGYHYGVEAERKEAVRNGAAEYRPDVNGRAQFFYKSEPVRPVLVPVNPQH